MQYHVVVETSEAELVAAVRVKVPFGGVAGAWKPALDQVWTYLRRNRQLGPRHNLFLYHHPEHKTEPMTVDFGVQVGQPFEQELDSNVQCITTPSGEVARTVHIGPYDRLGEAHSAIHTWCDANNRKISGASWEIYGDWNEDPAVLETTIKYLLT